MEKLFIIGNGFDIAHDLKTNYLYFKKFVYQQAYGKDDLLESLQSENAIKLYLNRIDEEILLEEIDDYSIPEMQRGPEGEKLYPDDVDLYKLLYLLMGQITETEKFWSDFEEKLADFKNVSIATMDFLDDDGDFNGSLMANNANEIGEILAKYIDYSLNKLFKLWIEETYSDWKDRILTKGEESHSKLLKDTVLKNSDALFINFNYTKTLEDLYRIPEKQVFHLHGVIDGKPVDNVLSNYNELFERLSSVKEIYFIGFGIRSEQRWVDSPYLKAIFKEAPNADILLDSYYRFGNIVQIKRTLKKLGAYKAYKLRLIDTRDNQLL